MHAHWLGNAPTELMNILDTIADTGRYSPKGMATLRRLMVNWNFRPRLLDLAILVAAIERGHEKGALDFILSRSFTRRAGFRQTMIDVCGADPQNPCFFDRRGLVIRRGGGEERVLWWNDMILALPPLFELLTFIDYDSMKRDCMTLRTEGTESDAIEKTAGAWQKCMYHWLRKIDGSSGEETEPMARFTQQRARHFSAMVKWLKANADDDSSPVSELLDDGQVLGFWKSHWPDRPGPETNAPAQEHHSFGDAGLPTDPEPNRSFSFVAELAFHLWCATDVGLKKMSPQVSIMIDAGVESGTISEEGLFHSATRVRADHASLLHALEGPPANKIRFLKKKEKDAVEPFVSAGAAARWLPLTLLRTSVFGPRQRKLGRAATPQRVDELLKCEKLPDYAETAKDHLGMVLHRLSKLRRCCLYVLVHLRSLHAITRIRGEFPDLACWNGLDASVAGGQAFIGIGEDEAEELFLAYSDAFFRKLPDIRLNEPGLDACLKQLATDFREVNTEGFRRLPDVADDIDDAYGRGDECLARISELINGFLKSLNGRFDDAELQNTFNADLAIFRKGFTRIYSGGNPS